MEADWSGVQNPAMVIAGCYSRPGAQRAAEFSGLNWMIKLSWTAILCYRRAFSVMCFRRSVSLRGRALVGKGLRLPSCCRAVKMRMTGSISCCRKRTYGPPLQPGVLSLRRSPNRSFVRSGAGCRPSICGWRSSCGGVCLLTECTPRPPLGSPKKRVDVTLQRSKCAVGLRLQEPSKGFVW